MVRVRWRRYIPKVDPTRMNCQRLEPEGEDSQRSRQDSDQEWAKSTRRTRPRRMKREAPMGAAEDDGGARDVD